MSEKTYFASAEKTPPSELQKELAFIHDNSIVNSLLNNVTGLMAVLDANRQVIAVNTEYLANIGVSDPTTVLGLRPGETLRCKNAGLEPSGCGTTKYCSSCGAAIAIVTSLKNHSEEERLCAISRGPEGDDDILLKVRAKWVQFKETPFILLFLQDVSKEQKKASLERTFYHDINNILSALFTTTSTLLNQKNIDKKADFIKRATLRLHKEIEIQRSLSEGDSGQYTIVPEKLSYSTVINELKIYFNEYAVPPERTLLFPEVPEDMTMVCDVTILLRILTNMITNAIEASVKSGNITIEMKREKDINIFHVTNPEVIPEEVQLRIFQRNFSTKGKGGRGVGTYCMKLFGEKILGGAVTFISTKDTGTVFTFCIPDLKE